MKNNSFVKVLPAMAASVICGVVFVSAGIVFGNQPNVNPPGVGVNPTFTGLTVNGDANISGDLQLVENSIKFWDAEGDMYGQLSGNGTSTIDLTGDLDVSGNLGAQNLGKYYRSRSALITILPGRNLTHDLLCLPGHKVVSCSVQPASVAALMSKFSGLSTYPDTALTKCTTRVYNSDAAQNIQLYEVAMCFDPTGEVAINSIQGASPYTTP